MPDRWLNWPLLYNPANWLIVFLMLAVAAIGITVIHASMPTGSSQ
jgi:hypothetical protein